MVEKFLAHKPANSASLTDSFIVSFSTLLIDLERKHSEHKTTFRARKVIGTFEKRTSVQIDTTRGTMGRRKDGRRPADPVYTMADGLMQTVVKF